MNKKRNVNFIKPEDPKFLKELKRQAGYDDKNHKFDELQNAEDDFVDDEDSELPQVVVLQPGDLTAEEAEDERKRLEKEELETKADLNQRVIFKSKQKTKETETIKRKMKDDINKLKDKRSKQLLSFGDEGDDDEES